MDFFRQGYVRLNVAYHPPSLHGIVSRSFFDQKAFDDAMHALSGMNEQGPLLGIALRIAVDNNSVPMEAIVALLEKGANPNLPNQEGNTAFHLAIRNDRISEVIIHQFVKKGACPNTPNRAGDTPFHLMFRREKLNGKLPAALFYVKGNPNSKNKEGHTPLHLALKHPNVTEGVIEAMLVNNMDASNVANPNLSDNKGNTPLHVVLQHSHPNLIIMERLLWHDANPNAVNQLGYAPLHNAIAYASKLDSSIFAALLFHGADPDSIANDTHTPLSLVFKKLYTYLIREEFPPMFDAIQVMMGLLKEGANAKALTSCEDFLPCLSNLPSIIPEEVMQQIMSALSAAGVNLRDNKVFILHKGDDRESESQVIENIQYNLLHFLKTQLHNDSIELRILYALPTAVKLAREAEQLSSTYTLYQEKPKPFTIESLIQYIFRKLDEHIDEGSYVDIEKNLQKSEKDSRIDSFNRDAKNHLMREYGLTLGESIALLKACQNNREFWERFAQKRFEHNWLNPWSDTFLLQTQDRLGAAYQPLLRLGK